MTPVSAVVPDSTFQVARSAERSPRRPSRPAGKADLLSRRDDPGSERGLEAPAPDGVLVVDRDGRIVGYSPSLARLWGIPDALLAARDHRGAIAAVFEQLRDPATFKAAVDAAYAARDAATRVELDFKDGRTFECLSQPQWLGGEYAGRAWTFRDVTAQRHNEAELRRSERSYRSLIEGMPIGIFRCTPDGRFTAVNPTLVEMLGYGSEAEVLQLDPATDLYGSSDRPRELLNSGRSSNRIDGVEVNWKRWDGGTLTVRLTGRALRDAEGVPTGYEMIAEDVSERRVLENQLRQAQKMEAVGQLAGGMAHDFNNLLTTILATTELIGAELPAESPLHTDLAAVRGAGERGAELVGKLLAFGRQQRLERRLVDVSALIQDFGGMMRRMVREDIEIRTMLEPHTTIKADPGALEQVLMNLVTNARDAMPGGGLLLIQARRCSLDWTSCSSLGWGKPGDYVVVSVGDTGTGMDRRTQKHIFEPFFTTKPVGQGTGLGLAVAYGLVRQHEGSMHVYSELGHGTTFKLYFPVAAMEERPGVTAAPPPAARGGSETILLVEDEDAIRRTAERVLTSSGYSVVTCRDGVEALEVYGKRGPEISLIVTDVVMPRMGGPQLLARIRESGHDAKTLFTSGYTARDVAETRLLEVDAPFLSKPWTIADLLRKIREVLDAD